MVAGNRGSEGSRTRRPRLVDCLYQAAFGLVNPGTTRTAGQRANPLRGWRRETLQDAVDFPVEFADMGSNFTDLRLAACKALFDGSQPTAEAPGRAADGKDDRCSDRDHGDDDGCGVRGGSPFWVATFRVCGLPVRRWQRWLGSFANRPPAARQLLVSGGDCNRQSNGPSLAAL